MIYWGSGWSQRPCVADDIAILSGRYRETQGLIETVNRHAASKTTVMSALITGEQRQAVLLRGEPLEDVGKFGLMFV